MNSKEENISNQLTNGSKLQKDKKSSSNMRDKAYNICRNFLSGEWKKISSSDMVFKTVRYVNLEIFLIFQLVKFYHFIMSKRK